MNPTESAQSFLNFSEPRETSAIASSRLRDEFAITAHQRQLQDAPLEMK